MHIFDYSFLENDISGNILSTSNIISDLKAREELRKTNNIKIFEELRKIAIIESVESSNAIEGIVTTHERVEELVSNDAKPQTHDEHEILGYKKALSEIYTNGEDFDLREKDILYFHRLMTESTSRFAGEYKKVDNVIQEMREDGTRHVRFEPVLASDTKQAMEQLVLTYMDARSNTSISPLLLIPCVIVDFLCIHPFWDGNGRISRLLTVLLLEKSGYDIGRYISIEKRIDEYKTGYYDALKASSEGWHENKSDYSHFIIYMLQIMYRCYKDLDIRFYENQSANIPKSKRVEGLLMQSIVPVSKEEICERLPEVSVTTVERVLGKLVKEGRIEKIGSYRNARYKCVD